VQATEILLDGGGGYAGRLEEDRAYEELRIRSRGGGGRWTTG
jgi:hypothetical protein